MTLPMLVLRYSLFAVIATLVNLGTQRLVLHLGEQRLVYLVALFVGTVAGLVVKYVLDKRWIFFDAGTGATQHGQKFALYTAMGIVTTAIFWGSETMFYLVWHTDRMRELGAVLGLAIGYVVKYQLDRRFVFTDAALHREVAQ